MSQQSESSSSVIIEESLESQSCSSSLLQNQSMRLGCSNSMFDSDLFQFLSTTEGFWTERSPKMSDWRSPRKSSNSQRDPLSKPPKIDFGFSSCFKGSSYSKMFCISTSSLGSSLSMTELFSWSFLERAVLCSSSLLLLAILSRFLSLDLKQLLSFFLTQNSISRIFLGLREVRSKLSRLVVISWKGFSSMISMTPTRSFLASDFISSATYRISFSSQFFSFLFFLRQQQLPDSLISEISRVTLSMLFCMLPRLFSNSSLRACSTWKRNSSMSSLIMLRVGSSQVKVLRWLKTNMTLSLKESMVWMFFLFSASISRKEFMKPILCRYWASALYLWCLLNLCRMFLIFSPCLLFPSGSWLNRSPALSTPTSLFPNSFPPNIDAATGCARNCLLRSQEATRGYLLPATYSISPEKGQLFGSSLTFTKAKPRGSLLLRLLRCQSERTNWLMLPLRWQSSSSSQNMTSSLIIHCYQIIIVSNGECILIRPT